MDPPVCNYTLYILTNILTNTNNEFESNQQNPDPHHLVKLDPVPRKNSAIWVRSSPIRNRCHLCRTVARATTDSVLVGWKLTVLSFFLYSSFALQIYSNGPIKPFKHVQRHSVSKGRVPIALSRLDCTAYELYDWLTYKVIDSRYLERPTLASRVPLFLLGHFLTNECETSDFCC